jgi:uncharacterized membrane protein
MASLEMSPTARRRVVLVDVLRGFAIVCMVAYHLSWDLSYLRFWTLDISIEPGWITFQRAILGSFLLLVGVGLVLGHGEAIRWRAFWRRLAIIAAAALAMSAGTYLLFSDAFAFFGILHAIVLFSLLGLLFLRVPWAVTAIVAAGVILAGIVVQSDLFNTRWLAWIGFWTEPPRTADLVAIFPWFGVTLLGIAATRVLQRAGLVARLARLVPRDAASRALAFAGRWSLLIYLLHQPLMLGVLYPLGHWLEPWKAGFRSSFVAECEPSCVATGGSADYCTRYCACALEDIEREDLWAAVYSAEPTPEQSRQVTGVITLCDAMAK